MADLERRLGEELRRRAAAYEPSSDLPARIGERTRSRAAAQRARRRTAGRVVGGVAVAAAVLVGLPLAVGTGGDDDEDTSAAVAPETTASGGAAVTTPASATVVAGRTDAADAADEAASAAPSTTAAGGTAAASENRAGAPPAAEGGTASTAAAGAISTAAGSAATTTGAAAAGRAPTSLVAVTADGVVVVDAESGAVVRSVAPNSGFAPGYSESGDEVYVFDGRGCGATVQAYSVADGSSLDVPAAWRDVTAVTSAEDRSRLAAARATDCAAGVPTGFELVLEIDGEVVRRPISAAPPDGGAFTFSPDGVQLAWTVAGGVAVLDVAAPSAAPQLVATPPGCSTTAPAFRSDGSLVVARRCGDQESFVVAGTGDELGGVPGLAIIGSLDIDPVRQHVLASGSTDSVETVFVVEPGGVARQVLAAATGAQWSR